jgi:hypothetical protein
MTAPTSIYTNTRPIWELRLLWAIERTLLEAAKQQPDPTDYLHSAYEFYEAAGWEPALALTLPHVPEQFRHLWTMDRARDLLESAFIIPMMKLDRQLGGRMMREALIPGLEQAGYTVEVRP